MRRRWVAVARGDEPADLVLRGGRVLSVFTGEVFAADVAIVDGHIVGVGQYEAGPAYDCSGKFVIPGLIDGHVHIESSKLSVPEFARILLGHGTTAAVVDPHELANVLGSAGIEYVLDAARDLPIGFLVKVPSCVPASPYETPNTVMEACDLVELLQRDQVIGLAEMMNFPAAIGGDPAVMAKMGLTGYRHIDGHAPSVTGRDLNAYLVSGPSSDHECTTPEEALEKRRLGMWIMIREASMIRNLVDLLPVVQQFGTELCMFCTDDREAGTLLDEGHLNSMVRTAVAHGVSPGDAVRLASYNVARYHALEDRGAVAPGYRADVAVLPDLTSFRPDAVFIGGRLVAEHGEVLPFTVRPAPSAVRGSVRIHDVSAADFRLTAGGARDVRVVELVPDQVVTRMAADRPAIRDGAIVADPERDLAKLAVVERHHATGRVGCALVRGFGLQTGAFASTIAHDAHNIVVTGVNDEDMAACVRHLGKIGGGLVIVRDGEVVGQLTLEIAGLMSERPAREVADALDHLEQTLSGMGVTLSTPFMYLGFLALSVIPEARVTDQGLFDVQSFKLVPLEIA